MPYQVLGSSAGAAAVMSACRRSAMPRSGWGMPAIAALAAASPSARLASALSSAMRAFIAARSSAVKVVPVAVGLGLAVFIDPLLSGIVLDRGNPASRCARACTRTGVYLMVISGRWRLPWRALSTQLSALSSQPSALSHQLLGTAPVSLPGAPPPRALPRSRHRRSQRGGRREIYLALAPAPMQQPPCGQPKHDDGCTHT